MAAKAMPDPFAEMAKHEKALRARLAKAPVVEVIGLVDAMGAGGGKSRGERLWTLQLVFDAWRVAGGPLRTSKLHVRRLVTDDELAKMQDAFKPETVMRVRARVGERARARAAAGGDPRGAKGRGVGGIDVRGSGGAGEGEADALLVEVMGAARGDAELNAHAKRLRTPVKRKDKVLGTLTFDRRLNWFSGKAKWNGRAVKVNLEVGGGAAGAAGDGEVAAALATAHALWRGQAAWARRVTDFAVARLLPLKNDNWLDEDEAAVTPAQFRKRMKLESITAHANGSFTFWHEDGDLFWGHAIEISGDLTSGPTRADIPG